MERKPVKTISCCRLKISLMNLEICRRRSSVMILVATIWPFSRLNVIVISAAKSLGFTSAIPVSTPDRRWHIRIIGYSPHMRQSKREAIPRNSERSEARNSELASYETKLARRVLKRFANNGPRLSGFPRFNICSGTRVADGLGVNYELIPVIALLDLLLSGGILLIADAAVRLSRRR